MISLGDAILDWFKFNYTYPGETSTIEWLDNKVARLTKSTEEILEKDFSAINSFADLEFLKLQHEFTAKLEDEILEYEDWANSTYCYEYEVNEALANSGRYQALNRMYDTINGNPVQALYQI